MNRSALRVAALFAALALSSVAAAQDRKAVKTITLPSIAALEAQAKARPFPDIKMGVNLLSALGGSGSPKASPGGTHLRSAQAAPSSTLAIDLTADRTPEIDAAIAANHGVVTGTIASQHLIQIEVPPDRVRSLAARPDIKSLELTAPTQSNGETAVSFMMEGDIAHAAKTLRETLGVSGVGVRIGVISNSLYDDAGAPARAMSAGAIDMSTVHIVWDNGTAKTGEGIAMLEIVHKIAPDAELLFISVPSGLAPLHEAIDKLVQMHCRIIVDDLISTDESPFGGGPLQALLKQSVEENDLLYFGPAGNTGNVASGASGAWEGWFADGGNVPAIYSYNGKPITGKIHVFGTFNGVRVTLNKVKNQQHNRGVELYWNDPDGAVANDYHLYIIEGKSHVVGAGNSNLPALRTAHQWWNTVAEGNTIMIVKEPDAVPRYLHLEVSGATLEHSMPGATRGHANLESPRVFSVAAVPTPAPLAPYALPPAPKVEPFSADGPRLIFFDGAGAPVLSSPDLPHGGRLLPKPDLAAADGVSTSRLAISQVNGGYFKGTSAAAPEAAGLAALLLSCKSHPSVDTVADALRATALRVDSPSFKDTMGQGILYASPNAVERCQNLPAVITPASPEIQAPDQTPSPPSTQTPIAPKAPRRLGAEAQGAGESNSRGDVGFGQTNAALDRSRNVGLW